MNYLYSFATLSRNLEKNEHMRKLKNTEIIRKLERKKERKYKMVKKRQKNPYKVK